MAVPPFVLLLVRWSYLYEIQPLKEKVCAGMKMFLADSGRRILPPHEIKFWEVRMESLNVPLHDMHGV
jgi:hypothetical protein